MSHWTWMSVPLLVAFLGGPNSLSFAEDWRGFRGNDGSGISRDESPTPIHWSSTENLRWSIELPGAGSSSPIVVGEKVLVTCYSGYGSPAGGPAEISGLKRHLVCVDRQTGKELWRSTVESASREDAYQGFITEHGYASSTPVSDGKTIVSFFGKAGVVAHDMQGTRLWKTDVGQQSGSRLWGSSGSPILAGNVVIVNASDESLSIRGLDKTNGKELWKAEARGLENTFSTPLQVSVDGHNEIVVAVPGEVWGMDPVTGKLLWYAGTATDSNVSPSPVFHNNTVFCMGGRSGSTTAIRLGGKDDVTDSHLAWSSKESSYVPSPVAHDGHLYWVSDRGIAYCLKAENGEMIYQKRLAGNRGSRGGRDFYASVALANKKLYAVSRSAGVFVLAAAPQFKQLGQNRMENDHSQFNGSPAISRGQIFLRSNTRLYCIETN
ncbi:MAG: PQQ-binding-like beta-propeller repeat protein [Planctomycetota bacterium]|nr:PQQ-binding-like beta-propeller repeat protein [Planctomycetota bacterium]